MDCLHPCGSAFDPDGTLTCEQALKIAAETIPQQ